MSFRHYKCKRKSLELGFRRSEKARNLEPYISDGTHSSNSERAPLWHVNMLPETMLPGNMFIPDCACTIWLVRVAIVAMEARILSVS